jgi:hypothetical protein
MAASRAQIAKPYGRAPAAVRAIEDEGVEKKRPPLAECGGSNGKREPPARPAIDRGMATPLASEYRATYR